MCDPIASRVVTCPVKLVSIIAAARDTSASADGCGTSNPVAAMTRSGAPPAQTESANAWWVATAVAS